MIEVGSKNLDRRTPNHHCAAPERGSTHFCLARSLRHLQRSIEGLPADATEEDTFWERVIRKYRLEKLSAEHRLSAIEADLLAEEYIARLELQWIQSAELSGGGRTDVLKN